MVLSSILGLSLRSLLNSGTISGNIYAIHVTNGSLPDINIIGQKCTSHWFGRASNTNFNITAGSVFTSEGSFNVNNFNINSNALFNMANPITANAVNNYGTLALSIHYKLLMVLMFKKAQVFFIRIV